MTDLHLRGGTLLDVLGPPARGDGFDFVPARVKLAGTSFLPECSFSEADHSSATDELRDLVEQGLDALWVRARIQAQFQVQSPPEDERTEKSMMSFAFVAARSGQADVPQLEGVPFECVDYYGRSRLFFGKGDTAPEVRERIGATFWKLLLSHPSELSEFQDRAYHSGAGVWMHFGRRDGAFFYEETEG
jgi:hypothetical protein